MLLFHCIDGICPSEVLLIEIESSFLTAYLLIRPNRTKFEIWITFCKIVFGCFRTFLIRRAYK